MQGGARWNTASSKGSHSTAHTADLEVNPRYSQHGTTGPQSLSSPRRMPSTYRLHHDFYTTFGNPLNQHLCRFTWETHTKIQQHHTTIHHMFQVIILETYQRISSTNNNYNWFLWYIKSLHLNHSSVWDWCQNKIKFFIMVLEYISGWAVMPLPMRPDQGSLGHLGPISLLREVEYNAS